MVSVSGMKKLMSLALVLFLAFGVFGSTDVFAEPDEEVENIRHMIKAKGPLARRQDLRFALEEREEEKARWG